MEECPEGQRYPGQLDDLQRQPPQSKRAVHSDMENHAEGQHGRKRNIQKVETGKGCLGGTETQPEHDG